MSYSKLEENNESDSGVVLSDVSWSYGNSSIIKHLSCRVPKGKIYGLLGPSGSGKTTLLKIILGRLEPTSGLVHVFGKPPHSQNHFIPGSRVGYAPQDLALYFDLTIEETLRFHSSLHCMSEELYQERKKFLMSFLELPEEDRLVSRLSGGQQRRVSLAVALLHNPELLILDEPTVGVDPLLRIRIWEMFREISATGVTILITTHYIDECRLADIVGLLRDGQLLAEDNPHSLMKKHHHNNLEDVFLELCRSYVKQPNRETSPFLINETHQLVPIEEENFAEEEQQGNSQSMPIKDSLPLLDFGKSTSSPHLKEAQSWRRYPRHILAISARKFRQLRRNMLTLLFELLIPTIEIFLFITCIGPTPRDLPFSVLNLDQGYNGSLPFPPFLTHPFNIGQEMTYYLKNTHELLIHEPTSLEHCIQNVHSGAEWGCLYIPSTFSSALPMRALDPQNKLYQNQSTMLLYMDLSNYQVDLIIQQKIQDAFSNTGSHIMNTTSSPIELHQPPVYGKYPSKFVYFLAPGMLTTIIFAHSIGLTAIAFIREKVETTIDRIFAAGVVAPTIILGHLLTTVVVLFVQTLILLGVVFFLFKVPLAAGWGSLFWVFTLSMILGIVGMSFGLLISTIANQETEGVQIALASFFPALLLSGVIWPVNAIPKWFSWISYSLPTTWAAQAMRSIMIRGWDISASEVWIAYLVCLAWIVFFIVVASFGIKSKDRPQTWLGQIKQKVIEWVDKLRGR